MKTWLSIAVAAAQVAVLAWMAGEREWVIHTGRPALLRTAPVDPRDPMRGDYVRLAYEISSVPEELCRDGLLPWFDEKAHRSGSPRDLRVFAVLRVNSSGIAELVALTNVEPTSGLFIRGRIDSIAAGHANARYGLEALFMQQGTARELELARWQEMEGVPLDSEVAVGRDGLAVLTGHRWEPLGLRLTLVRRSVPGETEEPARQNRGSLIAATAELKNHGDRPLAIVDRAGGRSFRLVADDRQWSNSNYRWVGEALAVPPPTAGEVVVLQPGEVWKTRIDFTAPEWFVVAQPDAARKPLSAPVSLETLADGWRARFRVEYVAPSDAECAGLPDGGQLRRMSVRSRIFSAAGGID